MSMTRSAAVMLVAGLLSLPSHAESEGPLGPSYSCAKAQTDTEKAICGDALLSALDLAMANAYQALLAAQPSQGSAIRSAQHDVITARDACDAHSACIAQVVEKRISAMLAMMETSGGDPKPGAYDAIPANSEASLQVALVDENTTTIDATVVDSYRQHLCSISGAVLGNPENGGFVFIDNNDQPIAGAPIITALDNLLVVRGGDSFCGVNVTWPVIWSR